jgi:hypothetical protein
LKTAEGEMKRTRKARVGSAASALDRFEEIWNKAARDTRRENALTVTSSRGGSRIIHRNAKTGSFTSQASAMRIRATSKRAADSLKRLAKR